MRRAVRSSGKLAGADIETGQSVIPAGLEMPQYLCGPLPTSLSLRMDRLSEE
jgi:hypothetical protein